MRPQIHFINNVEELTLPFIQLTKSKNGKTGTATFVFKNPSLFQEELFQEKLIEGMYLIWENKKIVSTDLKIFFKSGSPFLIRVIFLFRNSKEWFQFLNFMNSYSKETGLYFSESISSFD
jgi:photosystem II protein